MKNKMLKPYVGILLVVLYAIDIFWLSDRLLLRIGPWATFFYEALLVIIAVAVVLVFRGDLRQIFPFKKPEWRKVLGTLLIWAGTFMAAMILTLFLAYLFPKQVMGTSQQLSGITMGISFIPAVFLIAVVPAVCEELSFRGALMGSFRGFKNKWAAILLVSVLFGIFHGSPVRFVPTALLGVGMAYILFETDNMLYNMLFHMVNNMIPVILLEMMNGIYISAGEEMSLAAATGMQTIPLASVGMYLVIGSGAPLLLYMGNYFIHRGQMGYDRGIFPKEKKVEWIAVIASCGGMVLLGILLFLLSFIVDAAFYRTLGI